MADIIIMNTIEISEVVLTESDILNNRIIEGEKDCDRVAATVTPSYFRTSLFIL